MRKYTAPHTLILAAAIFGLLAIIITQGCRKVDREDKAGTFGITESRFFKQHTSSKNLISSIIGFLQRKNDVHQFVQKTVKQIGFPRWDKAIVFSKDKKSRKDGLQDDSANLVFIPFVRDNEKYVNACFVVQTSARDTSFKYVCDWQYEDTTGTGMKSKDIALLLMTLDKQVFSHDFFRITDTTLFTGNPYPTWYVKLKDSVLDNESNLMIPVAYEYTFTFCYIESYAPANGNLYGCPPGTSGPECNPMTGVEECTSVTWTEWVWEEDGSGGGGSGEPGGSGGGSGGGDPGGGTPPECPGGQIGTSGRYYTCGPGWVPVEEDPEAFDPAVYDSISITDNIRDSFPCLADLLEDDILNPNFIAQTELLNVFTVSQYINLKFDIDWSMTENDDNAREKVDSTGLTYDENSNPLYFATTIYFNPHYIQKATKEAVISTIFHEAIHAYINYMFAQYVRGLVTAQYLQQHFPLHWSWFNQTPPGNTTQHIQMANSYIGIIDSLTQVFYNPNAPSSVKSEVCNALAWRGLKKATGWQSHPNPCRASAIALSAENAANSLTNVLTPAGGCPGFFLPYTDSLKMSAPCH
jgi:hypothetical protein